MKQIFFRVTILICLFLTILSNVNAQPVSKPKAAPAGSWKLLGSVEASHNADHDAILIKGTHDYYRKIKFKVTDSPVNLQRIVVTYDDGLPEKIETRDDIPKGGESRVIDLKGGKRKLKSIEFWYDTKGFLNGKANVTVFGMK